MRRMTSAPTEAPLYSVPVDPALALFPGIAA